MKPLPPSSTLFPYTTLFRSAMHGYAAGAEALGGALVLRESPLAHLGLRAAPDAREAPASARRESDVCQSSQPTHSDRKSTRLNSSHVRISYAVFRSKQKTSN